jgi:putative membrane protein
MKKNRKILIILLTILLIVNFNIQVFATSENETKEEVIYANLNPDGSLKSNYIVNIFDTKEGNELTDYGEYTDIKNMTIVNELNYKDNKINLTAGADRTYYQGSMEEMNLPWNYNIEYYINDKKYSFDEMAGKSGNLKIKISVSENNLANEFFFENYALQVSLSLDTENFKDIVAKDSTSVNVGSDKQITYTILPSEEKDIEISSKVTDFEIDGITFNGISLNMDFEVGDTDEMVGDISNLEDGISDVDGAISTLNGSMEYLVDGIVSLEDGSLILKDSMESLNEASPEFSKSSSSIQKNISKINSSLKDISVSTESLDDLVNGSNDIESAIETLYKGSKAYYESFETYNNTLIDNDLDISKIQNSNTEIIEFLTREITNLNTQLEDAKKENSEVDTTEIEEHIETYKSILTLIKANSSIISIDEKYITNWESGAKSSYEGLEDLEEGYEVINDAISDLPDDLEEIVTALGTLKKSIKALDKGYKSFDDGLTDYFDYYDDIVTGYNKIYSGIVSTLNGSSDLYEGSTELAKGSDELNSKTNGMTDDFEDKINEIEDKVPNSDFLSVSFVSEKNENIKSVQFIMKTDAIEIKEDKTIVSDDSEDKKLNLWQKFLDLFDF